MNPNIHPLIEYLRRREAAEACAAHFGIDIFFDDGAWDIHKWLADQMAAPRPPERCWRCVESRIEAAFLKAREAGFEYYSTSLLYSRYQPHERAKQKGESLNKLSGPQFVYFDFREDWEAGQEKARELNLYRQSYCGCVYSEAERHGKKLERLKKLNRNFPDN